MYQPPDPQMTGSLPTNGNHGTGKIPQFQGSSPSQPSGRLILSQTTNRIPVVIPAEKKKQQTLGPELMASPVLPNLGRSHKFRKKDRRLAWYIISGVGILSVVLGLAFTVPLNAGQSNSTLAQGISRLVKQVGDGNMTSGGGGGSQSAQTLHQQATQSATANCSNDPSGQALPVGNLPGWHQVFTDNFSTNVALGHFPNAVSNKWSAYQDGWKDTSGNGE
ncbi:MAG TPA: hypothetical protein VGD98_15315, partial [Ktedonobacteraceae bacterium]